MQSQCLNYLTNIEVKFNRNQDLFAFNNKIFSLELNKFIKPKYDQYITLTTNYDYEDAKTEDVEFIEQLIYSIFPDEELRTLYCIEFQNQTLTHEINIITLDNDNEP